MAELNLFFNDPVIYAHKTAVRVKLLCAIFQVVTKRGTVYGDIFRYADGGVLMKVWKQRMEAEFDVYPTVSS